jgi:hypothetical protein
MFDQPLPRDPRTALPVPDSPYPHTQLGNRYSRRRDETYRQAREFGFDGQLMRDIDFTSHGRRDHTNPHQHCYDPTTGRRLPAAPLS